MNTTPYWFEKREPSRYPALSEDIDVDLLIVGGGITGITAAYLLATEGVSVALVERDTIGGRDTGHTTAHITYMTDTRLSELVATFSRREAGLAWDAGRDAMEFISRTVADNGIECLLKTVTGYLAAAEGEAVLKETTLLQQEALLARQMGFDSHFMDSDPITNQPCIRFENQMEFHPLLYIDALARLAADRGASIFEGTSVSEFPEAGTAKAGSFTIKHKRAFIATHVPLQGDSNIARAAMFQTKMALYSTYAIKADLPGDSPPDMIWSDTADPFLYLRIQGHGNDRFCILGGEDHKTGQEQHTADRFEALEKHLSRLVPGAVVTHRWSGQVVETVDGLPFIGPTSDDQFIATGFSGNGMTLGTAAALMLRDWMMGGDRPWKDLFDPSRKSPSSLAEYLRENKDYPVRMIADRFHVEEGDPASIRPGEGKVIEHGGRRVAAARDREGKLSICSAVCPHLGCIVAWNEAESTWDCPCHGSRFEPGGKVIAGPAENDLETI